MPNSPNIIIVLHKTGLYDNNKIKTENPITDRDCDVDGITWKQTVLRRQFSHNSKKNQIERRIAEIQKMKTIRHRYTMYLHSGGTPINNPINLNKSQNIQELIDTLFSKLNEINQDNINYTQDTQNINDSFIYNQPNLSINESIHLRNDILHTNQIFNISTNIANVNISTNIANVNKEQKCKKLYKDKVKNAKLSNKTEDICPICFENIYELQSICILNCKHKYHFECISKWHFNQLKSNNFTTCPTCRDLIV